ncbi:hypothetical protein [Peribacillus sp. SCS-155]
MFIGEFDNEQAVFDQKKALAKNYGVFDDKIKALYQDPNKPISLV